MTLKEKVFQNDTLVQTRSGELLLVVGGGNYLIGKSYQLDITDYSDSLEYNVHFPEYDIAKAWKIEYFYSIRNIDCLLNSTLIKYHIANNLLKEIPFTEPKKMTQKEIEEILGYPVEIVE